MINTLTVPTVFCCVFCVHLLASNSDVVAGRDRPEMQQLLDCTAGIALLCDLLLQCAAGASTAETNGDTLTLSVRSGSKE